MGSPPDVQGCWTGAPPPAAQVTETLANPEERLLTHPNRRRIVEHLEAVPGDHFRSIVRSLRLSRGTVRHHLLVLKRGNLVRSERIAGKCRFFVTARKLAPPMNEIYKRYWRQADLRSRVWAAVLRLPDPRPSTVAAALGLSRQLAAYHLKKLAEAGRVIPTGGSYLPVDSRVPAAAAPETTADLRAHMQAAFRIGSAMRQALLPLPSQVAIPSFGSPGFMV